MKRKRRKLVVLLMIFCMAFTMMPSMAFATGEADSAATREEQSEAAPAADIAEEDASEQKETPDISGEAEQPASEGEADKTAPEEPKEEQKKEAEPAGEQPAEEKQSKASAEDEDKALEESFQLMDGPATGEHLSGHYNSTGWVMENVDYTAKRAANSNDVIFKVKIDGETYTGTCSELGVGFDSDGKADIYELGRTDIRRKIAWKYRDWSGDDERDYAFGGIYRGAVFESMVQYGRAWMDDKENKGGTKYRKAIVKHWTTSSGNGGNGWTSDAASKITAAVKALNDKTVEELGINERFHVWFGHDKNHQDFIFWGYPVDGYVRVLKKVSSDAEANYETDPVKFSVKGAKFTLYYDEECEHIVKDVKYDSAVMEITKDGINVTSTKVRVPTGTYWLKETRRPDCKTYGFEYDEDGERKVHKVVVKVDHTSDDPREIIVKDSWDEDEYMGYLTLKKASETPSATNGNRMYTLAGAKYQVYTKPTCAAADKAKDSSGSNAVFTTKADGTTNTIEFYLGKDAATATRDVYVKEITAPEGYELDPTVYGPWTITPTSDETKPVEINVKDRASGAVNFTLIKTPMPGDPPVAPERLAGAQFLVEYFDVDDEDDITSVEVRCWTFETTVKGSGADAYAGIDLAVDKPVEGSNSDPLYFDANNKRFWPIGTYRITEIKAPTEFIPDPKPQFVHVEQDGSTGTASFDNKSITWPNEEKKVFIKKVDASGNPLSGATLQIFDGNTPVGSSWVTDGTDHKVSGLTEGKTYTLRELAAPAGYDIAPDQTFTAPTVDKDTVNVTMTNVPVTVGTTAKSGTTGNNTKGARKSNETIVDTIHMTGLTVGRSYKIVGTLMNKRTGSAVPNVTVSPVTFTATAATMDKEMTFTFDSTKLADNDEVVVYEKLYRTSKANASETVPAEGKEIAKHENINDKGQTVPYPPVPVKIKKTNTATGAVLQGAKLQIVQGSVVKAEWTTDATEWHEVKNLEPGNYVLREISAPYGFELSDDIPFTFDGIDSKSITMGNTPVTVSTTAVSKATSQHVGPRKTNEVITDTVHMTGLVKNRQYRLTGKLMNKRTGAAVPNVTVSPKEFTATAATMDVTMDFTFDSTQLADGDTVVVYETLHRISKVNPNEAAPVELGKHEDINAAGQSVIYPGISTTAIDQDSQTQNLLAGPNATIIDTVTYKGIQTGLVYTLEGELFDKTTNKLTGIKGTATIPANAPADGTVKMTFNFDASGMENHTLVVYETLKYNTVTLTDHKNPNDKAQSIYPPKVETTLLDGKTKEHLSNAAESVTLHDTVVCSNLIEGRTYTISGKLVYKDNGNDVLDNGNTVTATPVTFKAEHTTETKVLTFTFTGSALEGRTVVAFEDLYTNNRKVGTHADIKDEGQSDHIPKVRTTALDSETNDHISLGDESITIHDTVAYENLIPGKTYTLRGRLMDKTTGNEIPDVTCIPKKFTATAANGTEVMDFVFNGKKWQNHKTVAYEKLYLGDATVTVDEDKLVGVHENINDVDQTVHIPEIKTTLKDTKTTDHIAFAETTITLKDTIEYKKLIPGKEYVATGRLMNKRTGEPVKVDGKEVVSEPVTFKPEAEDGSVVVTFIFNGVALAGEKVVAFEKVTYKDVPVAVHENIEDKEQTVNLPKIRTVAAISDDNHVFTDTINYENLLPDRKYVFRGWLVDTVTGEKIPGSDGKVDLAANESNVNGSVQMEMKTDKYDDMYGHSMAAFEELYVIEKINGKDTEVKVAEHKDRTGDQNTNPQIIEIYHDLKVQKNVTGNLGDLTKAFEYTIAFTDLVPNMTYTVEGDDAKTFKAGSDGKAVLKLSLKDDQKALIKRLPKSSTYVITEAASDHVSEYKAFSEDMAKKGARIVTKEANNDTEAAKILATAKETVDLFDGTVVVVWQNNRDLATTTAVQSYLGIWVAALTLALGGIVTLIMRRRKYSAE